MTSEDDRGRLSGDQRAAMLAAMRRGSPPAARPRETTPPRGNWDTSGGARPGARSMTTHLVAGEMLGIANPFHRLHEGRSGAHATIDGRDCLNFASYDYLGLIGHLPNRRGAGPAASTSHVVAGSSGREDARVAGEQDLHRLLTPVP